MLYYAARVGGVGEEIRLVLAPCRVGFTGLGGPGTAVEVVNLQIS